MSIFDEFTCSGEGKLQIADFPKGHEKHGWIAGVLSSAHVGDIKICLKPNERSEKEVFDIYEKSAKTGKDYKIGSGSLKTPEDASKSKYLNMCIDKRPRTEKFWFKGFLSEDKKFYDLKVS